MNIKIPRGAGEYILFQRTSYLYMARASNLFIKLLYKLFLRIFSFNQYVELEAALFQSRIARLFTQDMNKEFLTLKDSLPSHVGKILDIGCGVAGIDVLLYHHYGGKADIYLLDKSVLDKNVFYYFEETGSFYNSLSLAKQLLVLNGVSQEKIYTQEATDENQVLFGENFDLVISLISWGFHYPVSTYLNVVYEKMRSGGILILDVRKDTDGEELLKKKFGTTSTLLDEEKYKRLLVVKR